MPSDIEQQAAFITAPHTGKIAVFSVGTTSARTNLADTLQLGPECEEGKFLTMISSLEFYYRMNNADAGTADETATSGDNRVFYAPAGVPIHFVLRRGYTWVVHKAPATALVRAYVSSKPPSDASRA